MNSNSEIVSNIEFSEMWLVEEIIKTDFQQKATGKIQYVKMKKMDLLKLVLEFVKINKRGE